MATFSTIGTASLINSCFSILDLEAEDWGTLFRFFTFSFQERKILIDDFDTDLSKRLDTSSIINKPVVSPMDLSSIVDKQGVSPKHTSGSAAGGSQNTDDAGASRNTDPIDLSSIVNKENVSTKHTSGSVAGGSKNTETVLGTNCTDA